MALKHRTSGRLAAASLAVISAFALTACSDDTAGPETGTDVEDIQDEVAAEPAAPYDGVYDSAFYDGVGTYVGQEVTVSADVNEILSPTAFTIAGTEDTDVEALLVVSATEVSGLEPDLTVAVTGTVQQAFDLAEFEELAGTDLEDDLFDMWDGQPYIEATGVDTSVASDE